MNRWNRLFVRGRAEPSDLLALRYDAGVGEAAAAEGAGAAAAEGATTGAAVGGAADATLLTGSEAASAATALEAGGGGGLLGSVGEQLATAAGTAAVTQAMAPKRPDLPKPLAMPDPEATAEAKRRALTEQMARRGRASTILTQASGDKLGG